MAKPVLKFEKSKIGNQMDTQSLEVITDYNQQQYSLIINSSSIKIIRTNVMILSELLLEVMWILVHMIILSEL